MTKNRLTWIIGHNNEKLCYFGHYWTPRSVSLMCIRYCDWHCTSCSLWKSVLSPQYGCISAQGIPTYIYQRPVGTFFLWDPLLGPNAPDENHSTKVPLLKQIRQESRLCAQYSIYLEKKNATFTENVWRKKLEWSFHARNLIVLM